ncbi:MAG: hypothetical protein QM768_15655 [Agriterribacter sp.]
MQLCRDSLKLACLVANLYTYLYIIDAFSLTPNPSHRAERGAAIPDSLKSDKSGNLKVERTGRYESGKVVRHLAGYIP